MTETLLLDDLTGYNHILCAEQVSCGLAAAARRFTESVRMQRQEQSRPELFESQLGEDERVSVSVGRVT